ncbi:MAG: response regulator [Pirellulaceae bacterium]
MKALIVDESRPIRRIESHILQELGFATAEVSNGREALEWLDRFPMPDIGLVDWNMPEVNGLEFIQTVRKDRRFDGMTLLMITAETEPEQMLRALTAGADEYLMKPFQKENLIEKLQLVGVLR